jgi:hypothetical protein
MTNKKTAYTGSTVSGGNNVNGHSKHTTTGVASQPVYGANGRVIGQVDGDTFQKNVRGSVHMLRKPRGWAVDTATLADLRGQGVLHIKVTDTESGTCYTAPLTKFDRYGVEFNRGFGPQVALPLGYWSVDGKLPRMGQPKQPDPDTPRQLALFAEV